MFLDPRGAMDAYEATGQPAISPLELAEHHYNSHLTLVRMIAHLTRRREKSTVR